MTRRIMGFHAIIEHVGAISLMSITELDALLRRVACRAGATVLDSNFHDFGDGLGNTGVLLLAESHITIHTWPEDNYAAIDLFVCSDRASVERAITELREADDTGRFDCNIIERTTLNDLRKESNTILNDAENISKAKKRSQNEIH